MAKNNAVIAIILGGGRGTRLFPLTRQRAKPAVPLAGKYRLIDIPISNCINSGVNQIFVLTQFMSTSLHRHIAATYKFDAFSRRFVELLPAEQTFDNTRWYQGTADAVRQQMHHFKRIGARDALILAGDHLYRMDYRKFIAFHREKNADVTLGAAVTAESETSRFGIFQTDASCRITDYIEKPQTAAELNGLALESGPNRQYLASMGIFLFRMDVLDEMLQTSKGVDFGPEVVPEAIKTRNVFSYRFNGYWEDIGTIRSFYDASLALTRLDPPFDFYDPDYPTYTRSRFLPPTQFDNCRLRQVVAAEGGWIVDSALQTCVIGLRSIIRPGSHLRRVIMMGADFYESEDQLMKNRDTGLPHVGIGENTWIEETIIDKNVRIGCNVRIHSQAEKRHHTHALYEVRDGIVVIPKNTVIPDGFVID